MAAINPTGRFSNRVEDYVKYRPAYPPGLLRIMETRCGFTAASTVADVGSGTGILSQQLLEHGNRVYGVEPNAAMRGAAESLLAGRPDFTSVAGTAEATTLPDASVDFITAGQAFHWFDRARTRPEFTRILRPDGCMVLVWNDRRLDTTPFLRAYEALLHRRGTDYAAVRHQDLDLHQVQAFVGPSAKVEMKMIDNTQLLDLDGLRGRLLSSSYAPAAGQPGHEEMLQEMEEIFHRYAQGGVIPFEYDTKIYFSHLP